MILTKSLDNCSRTSCTNVLSLGIWKINKFSFFYIRIQDLDFWKFTENTCARVSLSIRKQAFACNFIKKETLVQMSFCEFWEICQNCLLHRTPVAASEDLIVKMHTKNVLFLGYFLKLRKCQKEILQKSANNRIQ